MRTLIAEWHNHFAGPPIVEAFEEAAAASLT